MVQHVEHVDKFRRKGVVVKHRVATVAVDAAIAFYCGGLKGVGDGSDRLVEIGLGTPDQSGNAHLVQLIRGHLSSRFGLRQGLVIQQHRNNLLVKAAQRVGCRNLMREGERDNKDKGREEGNKEKFERAHIRSSDLITFETVCKQQASAGIIFYMWGAGYFLIYVSAVST